MDNYDGIMNKPDLDEKLLMHYGVKGMKWHKKTKRLSDSMKELRKRKYYAKKMADDILSGRRKYEPNRADIWSNVLSSDRTITAKSKDYSLVGGARKDNSRKGQVQANSRYRKVGEAFNTATPTYRTSKKRVEEELKKRSKRKK